MVAKSLAKNLTLRESKTAGPISETDDNDDDNEDGETNDDDNDGGAEHLLK